MYPFFLVQIFSTITPQILHRIIKEKALEQHCSNAKFIYVVSIYGLTCGQTTFAPTFSMKISQSYEPLQSTQKSQKLPPYKAKRRF